MCHWAGGIVRENESEFISDNVTDFLRSITHPHIHTPADILSFIGWYGVPVFVFLSGYGLVRKYEVCAAPLIPGRFMLRNWLKLVRLMLPGILVFCLLRVGLDIISGMTVAATAGNALGILGELTMINDPLWLFYPTYPGVYWYFGMTLELYAIYALCIWHRPRWMMWLLVVAALLFQVMLYPSEETESSYALLIWTRKNFIGWMTAFAAGIVYGRRQEMSRKMAIYTACGAVVLFIPSMTNELTWQLSPLCAIVIAIITAKATANISQWSRVWVWLGSYSAFLFAVHPIVRTLVYNVSKMVGSPVEGHLYLSLCIYLALLAPATAIYKWLWHMSGHLRYLSSSESSRIDR